MTFVTKCRLSFSRANYFYAIEPFGGETLENLVGALRIAKANCAREIRCKWTTI